MADGAGAMNTRGGKGLGAAQLMHLFAEPSEKVEWQGRLNGLSHVLYRFQQRLAAHFVSSSLGSTGPVFLKQACQTKRKNVNSFEMKL